MKKWILKFIAILILNLIILAFLRYINHYDLICYTFGMIFGILLSNMKLEEK